MSSTDDSLPPQPGGVLDGKGRTDRGVALGLLFLAISYGAAASTLQAGFLTDPIGPRAFPYLLAVILGSASVLLAIRPTNDTPGWPIRSIQFQIAIMILALVAYGYLIQPIGYLVSTTAMMFVLTLLFGATPLKGLLASAGLVLFLHVLFSTALGLYLPALPAMLG
jgi:putative tricarboxylic transport membrane protein